MTKNLLNSLLLTILTGALTASTAHAEPDRDVEVFLRAGDSGLGANLYLTDQLGVEVGFSSKIMSDKTFELDGFLPFAEGSYGFRFGAVAGLFWEADRDSGSLASPG